MRDDFWLFFDQALDHNWCDYLIDYATENYTPNDAIIGFENGKQDDSYRKSEIRWLNPKVEKFLVDEIWYYANKVNRDSFDLDLKYINEIQFTKYIGDPNSPGKYDWHQDVLYSKPRHRKFSAIIQLTDGDEYKGGDFELRDGYHLDLTNSRNKGAMLVFPSFLYHRITPIKRGKRKSIVAWIEGPTWM